jgi:CDP-diacylglycerol--inositol 3-phosphatidyltransferase
MAPKGLPSTPGFWERHDNVLIYVPNLIGYARLALVVYAFAVCWRSPVYCICSYFFSFMCDEVDGRVARWVGRMV